jgi:hypothetical protein
MQKAKTNLPEEYAAAGYEEFRSGSIKTFFDRPLSFREQLPELYVFARCSSTLAQRKRFGI